MEPTGKDKRGRRALGRGLDALLPPRPAPAAPGYGSHAVFSCPIERIAPQRGQPRKSFDDESLEELAATIRAHGIIQPLVVRRTADDRYEIVAGERRWRAAQRAGKMEVPVVVKDVSPEAAYELALVENLQREDLNPIEIAEAYARLLESGGGSQEELAQRVGKNRVTVTNALRLLKLPDEVRDMVRDGVLSEGHGRALLGAADVTQMLTLARRAVHGHLTVRRTEELVRRTKSEPSDPTPTDADKNANLRDLEMRISRRLATRASVEHKGPGGKLVVHYSDLDVLDRILDLLDA
jgi:ParB family chromosome partitioning protein